MHASCSTFAPTLAYQKQSLLMWALLLQPSYPCQSSCELYSCSLPTCVRVRVGSTLAAFLPVSEFVWALLLQPSYLTRACQKQCQVAMILSIMVNMDWGRRPSKRDCKTMAPEMGTVFVAEGLLEVWYVGNCKQSLEPGKLSTFFLASCCFSTFSHITSPRLFFFVVVYTTTS